MRKILILFFAIVALLLVACSNGDSASVDDEELSCAAASPGSSSSEFWVVSSSETALEVSSSSTKSSSSELYISYGMMVDERDGQEYKTVAIGNLVWMAENLNYAYLQPTSTLDSSSWCYNNEPDSCAKYGRLYLWSAALDSAAQFNEDSKGCGYGPLQPNPENYLVFCNQFHIRGACPQHWHLPSLHDFLYLDDIANSSAIVLKSIDDWEDSENGTNVFGFNILPAGYCHSEGNVSFHLIKQTSRFWAFEVGLCPYIDDMQIVYNENEPLFLAGSAYAGDAYSIRCVKDTVLGLQVSQGSMTDERDGQVYKTVTIGKQTWMAENLNYAYLQPTSTLDSSSWCYNNEPDSCAKYGRLYLWSAAVEACPEKWHLPSQSEMETLIIAMDYNASLMKSTSGWMDYSDGLDSYGITILPAGLLDTREINTSPIFKGIQEQAFLWSESPDESLPAYQSRKYVAAAIAMTLDNKHSGAYFSSVNVGYANSVRCVKDYDFALFE